MQLKADLEEYIGRTLDTPKDYQWLIDRLPKESPLSLSTLKRLWNYIPNQHIAREETLSVLARFLGYENWQEYYIKAKGLSDSDFLTGINTIRDIHVGDAIVIEWHPDRTCKVVKTEDGLFKVVEAKNTKLQVGDEFCISHLEKGKPLVATQFIRNGQPHPDYIAGKKNGISSVSTIQ